MGSRQLTLLGATLLASLHVMCARAEALDLNGAWVSDANNCTKVFERKGAQLGFTDMSDVYGGGFIIDGDQIIGKFARCRIKTRKDSGSYVNLIAACATDMMLSSVQFSCSPVSGYGRCGNPLSTLPGWIDRQVATRR